MERLTYRNQDSKVRIVEIDDTHIFVHLPNAIIKQLKAAVDRLAAYEDTDRTPEEFHAYWVFFEDLIGNQKASEALDYFRHILNAERAGRLVVLPAGVTRESLSGELASLADMAFVDGEETYTTGYRNGHKNGVIETLRRVLGIPDGTCQDAKMALDRAMKGSEGGNG